MIADKARAYFGKEKYTNKQNETLRVEMGVQIHVDMGAEGISIGR